MVTQVYAFVKTIALEWLHFIICKYITILLLFKRKVTIFKSEELLKARKIYYSILSEIRYRWALCSLSDLSQVAVFDFGYKIGFCF